MGCSFLWSNLFWPLKQVGFKKFEGLFTKWTLWDTMVAPLIYFVGIFCYFSKSIFKILYFVTNSMFFPKKNIHQKPKEIAKSCHNCVQYESVLKIFLLSYFEYHQICLNIFMDDHHLSNITKLKKKHTHIQLGCTLAKVIY